MPENRFAPLGEAAVGRSYVDPTPGSRVGRDVLLRVEPKHLAVVVVGVTRGAACVLEGVAAVPQCALEASVAGPVGHLAIGLLPP